MVYSKIDFKNVAYTNMGDWFKKDKQDLGLEFPNLPYMIDGNVKLTETVAIHQHLAEVYDLSLLGKNAKDKAQVNMLMGVIMDARTKVVRSAYSSEDK